MTTNRFNRITRDSDGVLVTETGYWVHRAGGTWTVCWDTVRGTVAGCVLPTLLAARRFIEIADGDPSGVTAHEIERCHVSGKAA